MSGKFASFLKGLTKTRNNLFSSLFSSENAINEEFYEELEESMILADVGVQTTQTLLKELRNLVRPKRSAQGTTRGIRWRTVCRR